MKIVSKGNMYITFAAYLNQLRADEMNKPASVRKEVPNIEQLASAADRHPINFSAFINGKSKTFNLEVAQAAMDELWRLGFNPQITDIIRYIPPEVEE